MSTPSAPLVAGTPVAAVPAKPLTAIQMIEQEIAGFFKQREQAIANVHACDGAIQAAQHLLAKLREAEAKAAAEVKKLAGEAVTEAKEVVAAVEAEAKKL